MSEVDLVIVEYGVGNIGSVMHACRRAGVSPRVVHDGAQLMERVPSHIILPGVGAIGTAIGHLRERGFEEPLEKLAFDANIPFLGICVGMQMLAERCFEFGEYRGLGWLPGAETNRLVPSGAGVRLPHVGWNTVDGEGEALFAGMTDLHFYFVHSYAVSCAPTFVVGTTSYEGQSFVSAVRRNNIVGVQFHPEKSSTAGSQLIANFVA